MAKQSARQAQSQTIPPPPPPPFLLLLLIVFFLKSRFRDSGPPAFNTIYGCPKFNLVRL
eukprot:SAG31_NODE_15345_length_759_cov_1.289394_1_plen_59_part_00